MVAGGKNINSKTKGATVTKQGHTTSGTYGSGYQKKSRYGGTTTEISK